MDFVYIKVILCHKIPNTLISAESGRFLISWKVFSLNKYTQSVGKRGKLAKNNYWLLNIHKTPYLINSWNSWKLQQQTLRQVDDSKLNIGGYAEKVAI